MRYLKNNPAAGNHRTALTTEPGANNGIAEFSGNESISLKMTSCNVKNKQLVNKGE